MKKYLLFTLVSVIIINSIPSFAKNNLDEITKKAQAILKNMSLKEKIGQKLMLDFRYWCPTNSTINNQPCTEDLTILNPTIKEIITKNHIGGIILFSNNLKDIPQITTLTDSFQKSMQEANKLPLLIGTDQEGGIVGRLPRNVSVSFPGNMAITAAFLGSKDKPYSAMVGKILAKDLKAVGINTNFAPDVDVNSNSLNPVIHVRSFSDDPELVATLGLNLSQAIQEENVASTLKHFPGHGDTTIDSHIGLPVVTHSLDEAYKIDLYPFKKIIEKSSPDLIMTAHIQYPVLDNSLIYASKTGIEIVTPATLSRKILHDLLRNELGYQGVVITDALNMGAIAQNFDSMDATIKAFKAGDDIALMPVSVSDLQSANEVAILISKIELAVENDTISLAELNQSVLRILKLKIKLGLLEPDTTPLSEKIAYAQKLLADKEQHALESDLTNDAITLVQNNNNLIPIKLLPGTRIHILTPWLEQGAGIAAEIKRLQSAHLLPAELTISFSKMADTDLSKEKLAIDNADIVIVGNSTTKSLPISYLPKLSFSPFHSLSSLIFPDMLLGDSEKSGNTEQLFFATTWLGLTDAQFSFQTLHYAKTQHKKTIFISLLAPYDLPNYRDVTDVMLAGYNYYGFLLNGAEGYYRGPSMQALTRTIFGFNHAKGKLPMNIPNPSYHKEIIYPRGYGLTIN